jgi:alanine dehydrogenase
MATQLSEGMAAIAKRGLMQTQAETLEPVRKNNNLFIGIPKEVSFQECRIALTPLSVALLVNNGHKVVLESGAGIGANFSDKDYSEQGALISFSKKDVYTADIIVKIAPPTLEEIGLMHQGQTLISALQLGTLKPANLKALLHKKINALCSSPMSIACRRCCRTSASATSPTARGSWRLLRMGLYARSSFIRKSLAQQACNCSKTG